MKTKEKNKIKEFLLFNYDLKVKSIRLDRFFRSGYYDVKADSKTELNIKIQIAKNNENKYFTYLNSSSYLYFEKLNNTIERFPFILKNKKTTDFFNMIKTLNEYLSDFLLKEFSVDINEPLKIIFLSFAIANFDFENDSIEIINKIQFSLFDDSKSNDVVFEIDSNGIRDTHNNHKLNDYFNDVNNIKDFMADICNSIVRKTISELPIKTKYNCNIEIINLKKLKIDNINEIPLLINNDLKLFSIVSY